jgi:hypothetical protein
MSEISIKRPFILEMELIEAEGHLPSMKLSIKIEITRPNGLFSYHSGGIWFHCSDWDKFMNKLNRSDVSTDSAALQDMGKTFIITVTREEQRDIHLTIRCKEPLKFGNPDSVEMYIDTMIDAEDFSRVRGNFNDFPVWW